MCIIFIAKNVHPAHSLIIAANRDEYLERPTQSPHWWDDAPHMFAGRDLQAGGTWMGYNRNQRIAAITNVRRLDLHRDDAKSRGEWVKRFLDVEEADINTALAEFTRVLEAEGHLYNPFNLLYGNSDELMVFNSVNKQSYSLGDGVYSISNGMLNDSWPKMQRGIFELSDYIRSNDEVNTQALFNLLQNNEEASSEVLPNTGISVEYEKMLSSIFIRPNLLNGSMYGTRSSSVLLSERENDNKLIMISQNHIKKLN